MDNSEQIVQDYLAGMGFTPERYDKNELRAGAKTPDFKVSRGGRFEFHCEVKSGRDPFDEKMWEIERPDGMYGGMRPDPIFNRLISHIHDASLQFKSVNADHAAFNVLAMVNYDEKASVLDLVSVTTGNFIAEGGARLPLDRWLAGGRVATDKQEIDAFLWFDPHKRATPLIGVNCTERDRHLQVCGLFKLDPEKVDPVWKPT
jgi:hypothetical protein